MFSFLFSLFHTHICLKLMPMCNRWLNRKARRCCIWNVMETLFFCDEDSCFNRKFCRFLFAVGWWNIYNQTDINNVSDSVVKLWRSRHLNTAQHSQLKPAVNVLQTTDTPKVEICTKCGVSHSQYMIFSCLSQAPRLPNGRPQIESVGRFPASFVATEGGYYLGEVGPCPASFVATILNFFLKVVGPSPLVFSRNQKRYLKPNLDVFLNLTKWFLCSRVSATEGEVLPCFSTLSVMTYFVCSHCVVSPTTFNFTAAAAFRTSQTMLLFSGLRLAEMKLKTEIWHLFHLWQISPTTPTSLFPYLFQRNSFSSYWELQFLCDGRVSQQDPSGKLSVWSSKSNLCK